MSGVADYVGKQELQKLTALNVDGYLVEIVVGSCKHCNEIVPIIEYLCCGKVPQHVSTVDNPSKDLTGYSAFVYQCPECNKKVSKTLKFVEKETTDAGKSVIDHHGETSYNSTDALRKPMCF